MDVNVNGNHLHPNIIIVGKVKIISLERGDNLKAV
jgi:hypothetical protein